MEAPVDTTSHGKWKLWWKKEYNLFSVWEPPMMYLAWKMLGCSKSFSLVGKVCLSKIFLSLNFSFELWHLYKSLLPSTKGLSIYFMQLLFWDSIFSFKAQTKGHYDRTWALGIANMRVCFMNGSMIEHDGLGITYFSVDILKDMVACSGPTSNGKPLCICAIPGSVCWHTQYINVYIKVQSHV